MKCPKCEYHHGWDWVYANDDISGNYVETDGGDGDFYDLAIDVSRQRLYHEDERKKVYACPSCGCLFIDVEA